MPDRPERVGRTLIHNGTIIDVYQDHMRLPDGSSENFDFIKHKGAAAVIPVMDDGRIIRDDYASGYTHEEEVRPEPITHRELVEAGIDMPAGPTYGDDASFDSDRDYSDDYDDDGARQIGSQMLTFGETESVPEVDDDFVFGDADNAGSSEDKSK